MTSFKLTSKTTREQLDRFGRDVVMEIARNNGVTVHDTKRDSINAMMVAVGVLKQQEEEAAREAEVRRQAILEQEVKEGKVTAALTALKKSFDKVLDKNRKIVTEFQAKVAESIWAAESVLEWRTEDVFWSVEVIRKLTYLSEYVDGQVAGQTHTANQINRYLEDNRDELLNRCLSDGYRHNSTSAVGNIQNMAKFQATQWCAKFLKGVCRSWRSVVVDGNDVMELGGVHRFIL